MFWQTPEYHNQKNRESYSRNKEKIRERQNARKLIAKELINEAKSGGCEVCGEKELVVLDFHHLHGKDVNVASMRGHKLERIREEISKCAVLCSNCHRKVHAGLIELQRGSGGVSI